MPESKYCLAGVEFRAIYVFHGCLSFPDVFETIELAHPEHSANGCRATYTERPDLGSTIMGHVD